VRVRARCAEVWVSGLGAPRYGCPGSVLAYAAGLSSKRSRNRLEKAETLAKSTAPAQASEGAQERDQGGAIGGRQGDEAGASRGRLATVP